MNEEAPVSGWKSLAPWRKGIYVVVAIMIGIIGAAVGGLIGVVGGEIGFVIGGLIGWVAGTAVVLIGMRDDIDYVMSPEYAALNPGGAKNWP